VTHFVYFTPAKGIRTKAEGAIVFTLNTILIETLRSGNDLVNSLF